MTGAASQTLLEICQCSAFESGTGHGRSSYLLYGPHLPNVMELERGLQFSLCLVFHFSVTENGFIQTM